ncbi:MAG: hypothetical protein ACT4P7_20320 [Gemmatimonadaceae bacterium]
MTDSSSAAGSSIANPLPTTPARGIAGIVATGRLSLNGLREIAPVAIQVGVIVWLMAAFQIESPAFYGRVAPIAAAGFVIHHFLTDRARLPFFLAISATTIWAVFGTTQTLWLAGLGVGIVAICHLPVGFWWRVGLLLVIATLLAVARSGVIGIPWSAAIWPILGSMFMFRLIAYMYDLRHQKGPIEWARALSYFFMLPNVAFPLFPVVDYATFKRTWFDKPPLEIYREGVAWMLRGVVHLLTYRVIYEHFTLSPRDVHTLGDYVQYAVANYGLYLRVSGQFHLVVGMLHLFGFRLPETHRFFYLASSFSDFWRRINIYWKDFMMKVVFYPTFFGSKKWGERVALGLSVCAVFLVSWSTHSYQWFWILGVWLWSGTDAAFWAVFGAIMVYASLRESKQGRQRQLGQSRLSWPRSMRLGLGTVGVFGTICALWTLWNSPSFGLYADTLRAARFTWPGLAGLLALLFTLFATSTIVQRFGFQDPAPGKRRVQLSSYGSFAALLVLWAAGQGTVARWHPSLGSLALDLRTIDLNARDADELQRGYYENLVGANKLNGQLWDLYAQRGENAPSLRDLGVLRELDNTLHTELVPLKSVVFDGVPFRTNRYGMRDGEYAETPAANTYRVALLGQSYVLGMGVGDRDVFEALVERNISRERQARGQGAFEILNFAMPRWSLRQQAEIAENGRLARFKPRAVVVVGHALDFDRLGDWVYIEARNGRVVDDSLIQAASVTLGLRDVADSKTALELMRPYREHLARTALRRISTATQRMGVERLLYVAIPMPTDKFPRHEIDLILRIARESGFEVHDLSDVYAGHDAQSLTVAAWDRHPNPLGHRLIATRLEALVRSELLGANAAASSSVR